MRKNLFVALAVTLWSVAAWTADTRSALDRFLADEEFCAYMASYPDKESDEFMTRFEAALNLAVSAMRTKASGMNYTQAVLVVRSRCSAVLNRS